MNGIDAGTETATLEEEATLDHDGAFEIRRRQVAITSTGQPVHEDCCGCIEFYWGCNAWPEGKPFSCADRRRLPDVLPGPTGQPFPPSRMQGRTEPRARLAAGTVGGELEGRPRTRPALKSQPKPAVKQPISEKRRKYMAGYMRRRRSQSDRDVPST